MKSCPVDLKPFDKAHRIRMEEENTMLWLNGRYVADAIMATIGNSSWFRGKGSPVNQYPKTPYDFTRKEKKHMSEDEKQMEIDKFFAQETIRRANWKRAHKS